MKASIQERRATLFVGTPIRITGENIPLFITTFGKMGLFPSVNKGIGIKVTPKGVEHEDVISLDMKYLDETVKMTIGPDRIDIVSKKADENWDSFKEFIMNISNQIKKEFSNNFTRYALCASVRIKLDQIHAQEAYSKLFVLEEENPIEWQLRKVNRTVIQSPDKDIALTINEVYNLSRNITIVDGINVSNIVTLNMDVNTLIGSSLKALDQLQELFWVSSACTIDTAINTYYSILSDEK